MYKPNLIINIIVLLLVNSCGFHLRGSGGDTNYRFPFKTVYVECESVVICTNFKSAIQTQELSKILNNAESAEATIKLLQEATSRDAQGFTSVGRASSYLLTYQVVAQVWQKGQQIGEDMVVNSQATMQYNDSIILSSNQNEVTFWDQLHERVTNQLVRRLIFFKNNNEST